MQTGQGVRRAAPTEKTCSAGANSRGLEVGAMCSGLAAVSLWVQEAECRDVRNRLSQDDPLALQQELMIMSSICPQHSHPSFLLKDNISVARLVS